MGLKHWLLGVRPEPKPEPVLPEKPDVLDEETYGYTAQINGNEVDGYCYLIGKDNRHFCRGE